MADEEFGAPNTPPSIRYAQHEKELSPGIATVASDNTAALTITPSFQRRIKWSHSSVDWIRISRPVVGILAIIWLAILGAGMWGWIRMPGLNHQIKELEAQVNRLGNEVDRLEQENDKYYMLNQKLNLTVTELQEVNQEMLVQVTKLQGEVGRLENQVNELSHQNDRFEQINNDFNISVVDLQAANQELSETIVKLENSITNLNSSLADLQITSENLRGENGRLAELNGELRTIASFLNGTASGLDDTFEELTSYLAEQINANRLLVMQTLRNTYSQQRNFWDCSFRDYFRGETFIVNEDMRIGSDLAAVIAYVDDRILSGLCLNRTDFEVYLNSTYGFDLLSANQLYQGVSVYVGAAMSYYFPNNGQRGVTPGQWAEAQYQCGNLSKFLYLQ